MKTHFLQGVCKGGPLPQFIILDPAIRFIMECVSKAWSYAPIHFRELVWYTTKAWLTLGVTALWKSTSFVIGVVMNSQRRCWLSTNFAKRFIKFQSTNGFWEFSPDSQSNCWRMYNFDNRSRHFLLLSLSLSLYIYIYIYIYMANVANYALK